MVRDDIDIVKKQQKDLQVFVENYNKDIIAQITNVKRMMSEQIQGLQKQLTHHDNILENLKPRMFNAEASVTAHDNNI